MAILAENFFKERKYPFILTLLILLICVTLFLFSFNHTTSNAVAFYSVIQEKPPLNPSQASADYTANPKEQELPPNMTNVRFDWKLCEEPQNVDFIPCLDNFKAIKALKSRRHMEHRERHCPETSLHCLLPLPKGYKVPVPWPKSRDKIWYDNVPYSKLVEYKKDQHWVVKSGKYLVFPGGGTQFKDGVDHYIKFLEKTLPAIKWGKHIRVVLDVGCGVASFGGYLLDKNVITMSFAPKDEHEAQIQFALERGIPATLSVIGTQKLTFPDNGFDLIHCARCRVHWDADGGKPLYELNRILRPGGFFAWSATPVYRDDERDQKVWNAMVDITKAMCWKVVAKGHDSSGIGLVIYQKPTSSSCYEKREGNNPPLCENKDGKNSSWYARLDSCLTPLPVDGMGNLQSWPKPWPQRLTSKPPSLPTDSDAKDKFFKDSKRWSELVSDFYMNGLSIKWSSVRNVMDMNAGYAGSTYDSIMECQSSVTFNKLAGFLQATLKLIPSLLFADLPQLSLIYQFG
ncbi:probable methyltransferase PMT23 isoform X2 [Glycine max]|uniref:Methyltransferase n=1 Tax=Glycine max TaxID=3847 RepID=A0A0R0GJQ5_SOYBN|nr:probable methyltransferase PMT23 isoform X2 [Glycine max]|eukprot:XP_014622475.1 probable methyltransferase PMT23 isoform X2 [Glycine max]